MVKLGALDFVRFFYWTLRRNRAAAVHMLGVPPRFLLSAARLFRLFRISRVRRPVVAIALMDAMGDIVAAEPIARLARRLYPGAHICWITRSQFVSLPDSYPEVDDVIGVGCLTEWMLLRRLKLFDVVWDLHHDGRMCLFCCIPQVKPSVSQNEHNYYNLGNLLDMFCDSAGLPRLSDGPSLNPPSASVKSVDALLLPPRFMVIHCVSSDPNRDWPADKWRDLIAQIIATQDVTIVEVGTRPLVITSDGARMRSLCGKLNMLETAEVIRRADVFIGIDSGPAHLANAVATPGVILLGAYKHFHFYMPYSGGYATGDTAAVIRIDGPVAGVSVEDVFTSVVARTGRDRSVADRVAIGLSENF
jgi:heptosyltransferase-3